MRKQLNIFLLSLQFFTRIPVPRDLDFSPENLNRASRYFSLVGILVGSVSALVFWAASLIFPHGIAVLVSMIASILLTGAFHEDGLADTCDGFGGGRTREQVLDIMKDSRLGTFGAACLIVALILKFLALAGIEMELVPLVLIAGHSLSRFMATLVISINRYVYREDSTKAKPLAGTITAVNSILSGFFGVVPLALLPNYYFLSLIPLLLIVVAMNRMFTRRIGGFTGDCLGAVQQVCEIAFYLFGALLLWNFT